MGTPKMSYQDTTVVLLGTPQWPYWDPTTAFWDPTVVLLGTTKLPSWDPTKALLGTAKLP